jgi:putative two-component system response regulator
MGQLQTYPLSGVRIPRKPMMACIQESWSELSDAPKRCRAAIATDQTEAVLFALAQAVEQRDRHTAGHCERMAFIGVALGVMMGLEHNDLVAVYRGGFLHDIGKVGIPDSILFKPGKLTADEWVTMRTHTTRGEDICRGLLSIQPVLPLIRSHHERWDGSGYPDGLVGEQIPMLARVLQVADIYDALTSPRPYKPAYKPEEALAIIESETEKGWRDPEVVSRFFRLHDEVLNKLESADGSLEAMRDSLENLQ